MSKSQHIEKLCQMFEIFISSQYSISIHIPEIKNFLRRAFKIDKAAIFFLVENKNIKLIRDFFHEMSSEMVRIICFQKQGRLFV